MTGKNRKVLLDMVHRFSVQERPAPAWAASLQKPLATLAWITDMHLGSSDGAEETTKIALNQLRDELKPDLVLFTGDNNKIYDKKDKGVINERMQIWLKRFIDTELNRPYAIIPGDNWPWEFERVFGSPTRSFDFKGVHFLLTATDAKARTNDSCAILYKDTKEWMERDLKDNADKPCLLVIHESVFPPLFLDAPWLDNLMRRHPSALAVLSGHIHMDLEFKRKGYTQFVAPAMGPARRPAFKMLHFYPDMIVIRTHGLKGKRFEPVSKWQRLKIPEGLRKGMTPETPAAMTNLKTTPVRPKEMDESLASRASEIDRALLQAASEFGVMRLFGK
jgi:3',5'-cyclic AMP phosphodiesterase CpdA